MKKKIIFSLVLFVIFTGFSGESRVVEQSNVNFEERVSPVGDAPVILKKLNNIQVHDGYPAAFSAEVSTSNCNVIWYNNLGQEIKENEVFKLSFVKNIATLVIMSVVPEDAGIYRVKFRNAYGEEASTARLFVILRDKE